MDCDQAYYRLLLRHHPSADREDGGRGEPAWSVPAEKTRRSAALQAVEVTR